MKTIIIILLALQLSLSSNAESNIISGSVTKVIDGNTFEIKTSDNELVKILLYGVDCPEKGQAYYDEATKCLERILLKKNVNVEVMGKDRSGNSIGIVVTDKKVDPRIKLLVEGLAWTDEKEAEPQLELHKKSAAEKGKGIWAEKEPTPPWIYRRQQSMMQPKSS
jgi:endonuclease YncB( thermonuclease family)